MVKSKQEKSLSTKSRENKIDKGAKWLSSEKKNIMYAQNLGKERHG